MGNYSQSVKGQKWTDLRKPPPTFTNDIRAWLEDDGYESPHSATFWHKLNLAAAHVIQGLLSIVSAPLVSGLTIADHLAILLMKGLSLAADMAHWVFLLIRKMMRMLQMKVVESVEELRSALIRMVLDRVMKKIHGAVNQALNLM